MTDLTPDQYAEEYSRRMRTNFVKLIEQKFGTERGSQAAAAAALSIYPSNMSNLVKGSAKVTQRHIDALSELPDYIEPELPPILETAVDIYDPNADNFLKRLTFDVGGATFLKLRDICTYHNEGKEVDLTDAENITRVFSFLVNQEFKAIGLDNRPDDESVLA